jgi:hypothetical protein
MILFSTSKPIGREGKSACGNYIFNKVGGDVSRTPVFRLIGGISIPLS